MTRLPEIYGDRNRWGAILLEFLRVVHNDDGTLKATGIIGGFTATRVPFADGSGALVDDSAFTYNAATDTLTVTNLVTGTVTMVTPLPVASGGTGAATAANARTNLGLTIGTDVQAFDATLAAIAGLVGANDKMIYFTGADAAALADITAFGRSLLDDANAAAGRATLSAAASGANGDITSLTAATSITGVTTLTMGAGGVITPAAVSGTPAQHGLYRENFVKAWHRTDVSRNILDSFNITSVADTGTGTCTTTIDRDFANTSFAPSSVVIGETTGLWDMIAVGSAGTVTHRQSNAADTASDRPLAFHAYGTQA